MTTAAPKLPIRRCRVMAAEGREVVRRTVLCPLQGRSTDATQCGPCPKRADPDFDPGRSPSVGCSLGVATDSTDGQQRTTVETAALDRALRIPVHAVMSTEVLCVGPDMPVQSLILLLVDWGVSGVPVVDGEGRLLGVASKSDVLLDAYEDAEAFEDGAPPPRPEHVHHVVKDIMSPGAVSVAEAMPLAQAAALMAYEGVHRLPVVDAEHRVVGLVSPLDVLNWIAQRAGYTVPPHVGRGRRKP